MCLLEGLAPKAAQIQETFARIPSSVRTPQTSHPNTPLFPGSLLCAPPPRHWSSLAHYSLFTHLAYRLHVCAKSLQSFPTLCNPRDCSPPGFSVHGILQARIVEWLAMPSSREPSQPKDRIRVSCIGRRIRHRATCIHTMLVFPATAPVPATVPDTQWVHSKG